MKKNIIKTVMIAALIGIASLNINFNSDANDADKSLLALNNEALANCEFNDWVGNHEYYIEYITMCWWTCTQGGLMRCPI